MFFTNDIVLELKTSQEANTKVEEWSAILEYKGLRISPTKIEYLRCNLHGIEKRR